MKDLRLLGSTIHKLSLDKNISEKQMRKTLGCSYDKLSAIYDGRVYPSFDDLQNLSKLFGTTVEELLNGDENYYNTKVVHCIGAFSNTENREKILDIIDDYLNLFDLTESENKE